MLVKLLSLQKDVNRWKALSIFAILLAIFISIEYFVDGSSSGSSKKHIASVTVAGELFDTNEEAQKIRDLSKDNNVSAVIVRVDSPGGSSYDGELLYNAVKSLRKKKPVVVVVDSVAASGGYMVAIAGERIFASNTSIIGSVGVLIEGFSIEDMLKKLGVLPYSIKSSHYKNSLSPYQNPDEDSIRVTKEAIMETYKFFIQLVLENRKIKVEDIKTVTDGRIFVGTQALQYHLIDEIGGVDEAKAWLHKHKKIDASLGVKEINLLENKNSLLDKFSKLIGLLHSVIFNNNKISTKF